MLCGFGGQGIVLAGVMLGHAAFKDGKWVSSTNSYGAASRGGECRAEVVMVVLPCPSVTAMLRKSTSSAQVAL